MAKSPAPKVLYRKYRPTKLSDVIGQEQITTVLENSLKQQKIAHAYLFIGPRGTGKTSVARIFAHAINDFDYTVEDHYLDIIEIDAASNTGVDNIRELREKSIIAPTKGKYKVYIIDEVHMLTKSASNALLKTLEEPPAHVVFIMATTDAHKVPITISSRTQVHTFKLADPDTMFQHLQKIAKTEKIKITPDALLLIVKRGGGSYRDSLSLLDQVASLSDQEITLDLLSSAFGLPEEQIIQKLLEAYQKQDINNIRLTLQELLNSGIKPEIIASELIDTIVHQPEISLIPLLKQLPDVQPPFSEAKLLLALLNTENHIQNTQLAGNSIQASAQPPKPISKITPPSHPTLTPKPAKTAPNAPLEETSTPEPAKNPPVRPTNFTWEGFTNTIKYLNSAIYNELQRVEYEIQGDTLHLYPERAFTKNILNRPNNSQLLTKALPENLKLLIHDPGSRQPKDSTISQISDIMGNIQEVSGEMPF